jgi:DNA-binding NtrC family response regulator
MVVDGLPIARCIAPMEPPEPTEKRYRVLVVDDHPEMVEVIVDDLRQRGYDGLATSSGHDALRLLAGQPIDALITDVRMPGVGGLTLLRASMSLDPKRPVILMTAYGSVESAIEAVEHGSWYYLIKPFRMDVLVRLLEQALGIVGKDATP